ncbi:MAG: dUTP diphosphatase [Firmicutes bacterium]|nr:dUTP diphosphatase [Bacillota bacterium]
MEIKIVSKSGRVPAYATSDSAGFDLPAYLPEGDFLLKAGERALVPTGFFVELPPGYEAQIRARSGLAIKHGIGLVNGIGTVDPDYRGEWNVPLINWSKEDYLIKDGERIAQAVITKFEQVDFQLVEDISQISETERGSGGFGHTGKE